MDDELIEEFLDETSEALSELDVDIVNLEQNPEDSELIGKIFRLVHTIKGTCGFLGLPRLETVAHHSENVLGRFRDGDLKVTPEYITLILEAFDIIKEIVASIEETGSEPEGDDSALLKKLDDVYNFVVSEDSSADSEAEDSSEVGAEESPEADASADEMIDLMQVPLDELRAQAEENKKVELEAAEALKKATEKGDVSAATKANASNTTKGGSNKADSPKAGGGEASSAPAITQSLRVNVQVLEDLMTMVSELVLTRNQLLQILRSCSDSEFSAPLQRLNQVVSELQEGVMKTRMQPIGNAWGKLPRIVRDIGVELNKKIQLEMRGQDTELDRQVLDMVKDPLTHMVRNSGDHGIETPEERLAVGKSEEGHILLNAFHEGGHIIIEISDDGKGLSTEKIKEKVLMNGLATAEDLAEMSDQQIHQFIFHAGLSTAEKVTSVSGRGVGMDVVRNNIEKIGGTIELKSIEGKGSTFTIKIPLTLAIVSALIVEVAGQRYAIPQLSVQELVRTTNNSEQKIETIKGTKVLRLRERLLPLISLDELLKLETVKNSDISSPSNDIDENIDENEVQAGGEENRNIIQLEQEENYIIVTQVGSYTFGIVVDKVFDTEEIVVKPVSHILSNIDIYAGNTILGDGSVVMILDPNGIANASGEVTMSDSMDFAATDEDEVSVESKKTSLLVFSVGGGAPKAVPLSLVSRLEDIDVSTIEETNDCMVVQYRGQLMPIIPFDENMKIKETCTQSVLVFSENNMSMGIMVDEIVDIVEEVMNVQLGGAKDGILGSAIISEQAMDIIDVGYYLGLAQKRYFAVKQASTPMQKQGNYKILVVDDSKFFQEMLTPLLSISGYEVKTVSDANMAFNILDEGEKFDLIISDIEMPDMNGFEFVEKLKSEGSLWKDIPVLALSSHSAPADIERGIKAGFDKYVMKFDKEEILKAVAGILGTKEENRQMGEVA